MVQIAVTGAAGNVGREALAALEGESVTPMTHSEHDDIDSVLLDVTDREAVAETLDGYDVVVHLAGASSPDADWDSAVDTNVHGTYAVYEAAVEQDISRVVFASSNHAVGMYNAEDPADAEAMTTDAAAPVRPDDPPRPDGYYGVSKVACEALGNYYADRHGVETVNLRIGWYMDEEELAEAQDRPEPKARFARAMWLSPRDCRAVLRAAALADLPENPVTVNAVSRNDDRFLTLTEATQLLGYRPRDNAAEALDREE